LNYKSTRSNNFTVSASEAIVSGISQDGGLFVPTSIPKVTLEEIKKMTNMSYVEKAVFVLSKFLTDFSNEELKKCVSSAYNGKFDTDAIVPLSKISDESYLLELWHGPTCAFKDMALQLLPHLMRVSADKVKEKEKIVILVATSGDTGKAALEGFKDVKGTEILVFYPSDGVSSMQKLQMSTQQGENVHVFAIKGNFDDAQSAVKNLFTDKEIAKKLLDNGCKFSSANSINWGRLVPQIVYYFSAYCELLNNEEITENEQINVVVPTGNFGNILAAYYAKCMGLPIKKLICASNSNNVLTDFIKNGVYDRNRDFYATISPSMDILISSNLERFLYHISGENEAKIAYYMLELKNNGRYEVDGDIIGKIHDIFDCGCCDDNDTKETIKTLFKERSYLCDTHTAVAVKVYNDYKNRTQDTTKTVIASTANPYKFPESVLSCFSDDLSLSDFDKLNKINQITRFEIPTSILDLNNKQIRFTEVISKDDMENKVYEVLKIK
jgi:threonine synthase